MRHYWQVAAGNKDRNYSSLFLKHGLAFVGGDKQIALAGEVKKGDVLLLKGDTQQILAAGIVVERNGHIGGCKDKAWVRDVEGWDLPAYLFVDWCSPGGSILTTGLTRSTISRTHSAAHHAIAEDLLGAAKIPLAPEPEDPKILSYPEILAELKASNRFVDVDLGLTVFENIRRIATEEFETATKWTAEETTNELVMPLLRVLGWKPGEIRNDTAGAGVGNVVSCFPTAQRNASTDMKVFECRPFYNGMDLSPEQSQRIGKVFTGARALAVTNGVAIKLYSRLEAGSFGSEPSAYVNLASPAERCPSNPKISGAMTALRFLAKPE